jgi:hypothetical protein
MERPPDRRYPRPLVSKFARELAKIPPEIVEVIRSKYDLDQEDVFYEGLLAGLAAAYATIQAGLPLDVVGAHIAFVADMIERKEVV